MFSIIVNELALLLIIYLLDCQYSGGKTKRFNLLSKVKNKKI